MKVLLTGATGFVGSHILDALRAAGLPVRLLLRRTSNTRFIRSHLPHVELFYGSLHDSASLEEAVRGVECVIHCAGKTKVARTRDYYAVNRDGTRNLVRAINERGRGVRHLVHISSRAASGWGTTDSPPAEEDGRAPASHYGMSKLLGEREVTHGSRVPYTVLRPSAVYGPRDTDFLHLFRTVRLRLMPLFDGGRQQVNLVYVRDVAEAVLRVLGEPGAFGRVYHVASPHVSTSRELMEEIARQMRVRAVPLHLPTAALYPVCALQQALSRLSGRPSILNLDKYRELRAAGWVCSVERIRRELGFVASTPLAEGVRLTLGWYRKHGWL